MTSKFSDTKWYCLFILLIDFRHFIILRVFLCFLLPTMVPVYCWGETWSNAIMTQCLARYCFVLHITWAVNSFAHMYGSKPYDA